MYRYNICSAADEKVFSKQCIAIEKKLNDLKKIELLIDVDGSKIQKYEFRGESIKVVNSIYTDEVYVESSVDIKPFFT